jgi:hypothetical protein
VKYRWLDSEQPVRSVGKQSTVTGKVGRIVVLPKPGRIGNCLVDFAGTLAVVPAGTLRPLKSDFPRIGSVPVNEPFLEENLNSCGGGHWLPSEISARLTDYLYDGRWEE